MCWVSLRACVRDLENNLWNYFSTIAQDLEFFIIIVFHFASRLRIFFKQQFSTMAQDLGFFSQKFLHYGSGLGIFFIIFIFTMPLVLEKCFRIGISFTMPLDLEKNLEMEIFPLFSKHTEQGGMLKKKL